MITTLVDKLRIQLPKAIKLFPGGILDGNGIGDRFEHNGINNNRLESLNLLFLYLNKCLLEILDDNHKVDEERIQEALECFDAFIGLFVTLESELIIAFLQSDLKSFSSVTNLAIRIFANYDRLYFSDALVDILSLFTGRMRLFAEGGCENLILTDKIYYKFFKTVSSISITSSSLARSVTEVYCALMDLNLNPVPIPTNLLLQVKASGKPLKLLVSPQSFLKVPLSGLFQIPFFFTGVDDSAANGLRKASLILQATSQSDCAILSIFCQECCKIVLMEKQFSANDLWRSLPQETLSKAPHLFKHYVLPLVLLCASLPANNSECKLFIRMITMPNLHEMAIQSLVEISSKRGWSLVESIAGLTLPNLRRFAFYTLSDSFSFDSTTFLVSLLHNEEFSSRLDLCKCLAQNCASRALRGYVHYLDNDVYLDCIRVTDSPVEYVYTFFEPILRLAESGFATTLVEQESLGIWTFALAKHLTTCHLLVDHPFSHQSVSDCVSRLLLLCQKGGTVEKSSVAFFMVWGLVLGSGPSEDRVMKKRLWGENSLSFLENSPFSFVNIPPCSASILDLCFELLLKLRKCEYLEIRVRVLRLCKWLTGNIQESCKVMNTDYTLLSTIYCIVLGAETLYSSEYRPFDKLDQQPEIVELVGGILDYGHRVHFITFQPAVLNRSTLLFPSSMTSAAKERARPSLSVHTKKDVLGDLTYPIRSTRQQEIFSPGAVKVNQIDNGNRDMQDTANYSVEDSCSTFSIPVVSDESFRSSRDRTGCGKKDGIAETAKRLEELLAYSEQRDSLSIEQENADASAVANNQSFFMPLDFGNIALETGISHVMVTAQHEPPHTVKSVKGVDEVMRFEELAEVAQDSLVDEFLAAKTFGEDDMVQVSASAFNDAKDNVVKTAPDPEWMPTLTDEPDKNITDVPNDDMQQTHNESLIVQQSAHVKLPFAKASIVRAIPLVVRHLVFSRNVDDKFSYFDIYSDGLLCGTLQFSKFTIERALKTKSTVPLHPGIRDMASLDMHLLLELVQDFEMLNVTGQDELFLWVSGLNDLHRHFLPLSRSLHAAEGELRRELSLAECMVIARDKISVVKLSSANSLSDATLDKIEASTQNLFGSGIEHSRILGSMILIEDTFTKWLSFLL